jgi:uncharacterized protein YbjT (DUF2867 family)
MDQQRILITGGSGTLGRQLTPRLQQAGYTVRILSRRPAPASTDGSGTGGSGTTPAPEWAQAEIETGAGLAEALTGVDTIIHAASSAFKNTQQVDVEGTGRLLAAAKAAAIQHFLYISIVGIERIPFSYYQAKLAAEKLIEASDLPYSILRTTQFHNLLDQMLNGLSRYPLILPLVADMRFQPIDEGEVAELMVKMVAAGPAGRVPDAGGPELKTAKEFAQAWLAARGLKRRILHLPIPGKVIAGYRQGYNCAPDRKVGRLTWADYLRHHYQITNSQAQPALQP